VALSRARGRLPNVSQGLGLDNRRKLVNNEGLWRFWMGSGGIKGVRAVVCCAFCWRVVSWFRAINDLWQPSFWLSDDVEVPMSVCPCCAGKYLTDWDSEDGGVLIAGQVVPSVDRN